MKRVVSTIAAITWASVAFGCAAHPAQPSRLLGQPFELRAGGSTLVADALRVTFTDVKSDSRCPIDAFCVQAGEAIVALKLSASDAAQVEREVRTTPALSEVSYLSYTIKLIALAPFPKSTQQIRPEEYVATLTVDRR
jgi:hypothetical protein